MNFKRNLTILVSTLLIFTVTACVSSTNVTFYTDAQEAEVYVDGELIGSTPATAKLSNGIWNDPTITIKKDGYKTLNSPNFEFYKNFTKKAKSFKILSQHKKQKELRPCISKFIA